MIPAGALEWLRSAGLKPLWSAVRERLLRNGRRPAGTLTVRCAEHSEREAVGQLLGHAVGPRARIDLAALDVLLRGSAAGAGLIEVVEAVTGAVPDRRADAAAEAVRRTQLREHAQAAVAAAGLANQDWVSTWLDRIWRGGMLGRLASAQTRVLLTEAAMTLGLIFTDPPGIWARGELAERVTGTAHGLDDDTLLCRLVTRGIALATTGAIEPPTGAVERRALWEAVGVVSDMVATTVLTYGLRPLGGDWRAALLRERAERHAETHLTLRELRELGSLPLTPQTVYVCENPRVLEAAAQQRVPAALVCTLGNPTTVTLLLLDLLASAGDVRLCYHGDFDWPGIAIGDRVMRRVGAVPWRFGAADYRAAARAARERGTSLHRLSGAPVVPSWDPELGSAMGREGVAVHEEGVIDTLLMDLAGGRRGT